MSPITAELPPMKIALGGAGGGVFDAGLPVLAGDTVEDLFGPARPAGTAGKLALYAAGDWLLGGGTVPLSAGLEAETEALYRNIFTAVQGRNLARIWNYVPAINEAGPDGLEHYQAFCRGRSLAFERQYGRDFKSHLPAASAVGSKGAALTVAFAAGPGPLRHVENPLQLPAYDYPESHGPRSPSFARATVVPGATGATVFISGTAAIRGHATIAPHDTRRQLACALENLRMIFTACGLGPDAGHGARRHLKVYLRHAADQPQVAQILEQELLQDTDRVSYVLADICRAALLVEIELSIFGVKLT